MSEGDHSVVELDGKSLTLPDLVRIARDPRVQVKCSEEALERVRCRRKAVQEVVDKYRADWKAKRPLILDYGITTGFGEFKDIPIDPKDLEKVSANILLSHSAGAGETSDMDDPANYFPAEIVRAVLALRLNIFLKGHSGVREELVRNIEAMLNKRIVPLVPLRGSVGSSGDLAPLSHLFAVLVGEGRYYSVPESGSSLFRPDKLRGAAREKAVGKPAARKAARAGALRQLKHDLERKLPGTKDYEIAKIDVDYKEGLALTNGATFSAAVLALAVYDAEALANAADVATALSLTAICGCARALEEVVHEARGHRGQIDSAANLRELLKGSKLLEGWGAVQDAYSLRCAPQVHGATRDAIAYARMVIEREINAATDNPLFFDVKPEERWDFLEFKDNWPKDKKTRQLLYNGCERTSYSVGNFHGQPVGLAADFLAIGLAELADISERRIQLLLDCNHNRELPSNLIPEGGINSGYMIAQYCAASLVSENKVLTHPASVDSIPTSANSEDHNSMASIASRKLRTVLHNVQAVLAIELLVSAQAIEWRVERKWREEKERQAESERQQESEPRPRDKTAPPANPKEDPLRFRQEKKEEADRFRELLATAPWPKVAGELGDGTGAAYLQIRKLVAPMLEDRVLDEDIRRIRETLEKNTFIASLDGKLKAPLRPIPALCYPGEPGSAPSPLDA